MDNKLNWFQRTFNWGSKNEPEAPEPFKAEDSPNTSVQERSNVIVNIPAGGRDSKPDFSTTSNVIDSLTSRLRRLESEVFPIIPLIRKLSKVNPDLGQAFNDIVQLANTGFKINFDPSVTPEVMDAMRLEVEEASKNWSTGVAGCHGLANKMFSQAMIGGAISNEWVPNKTLTGIRKVFFVNPENIRFIYDEFLEDYLPHQHVANTLFGGYDVKQGSLVKLNPRKYRYYALNGDEDIPYGSPPYWASLDPINTQEGMMENIKFVSKMLGLLGYMDVKIEKPFQEPDESVATYTKRLEGMLDTLKARVKEGFKDGINVGFKDDHEFDFHSATKDVSGAEKIFSMNEQLVSSGLKYDSAFLGRAYGGSSDGFITILFTKMISQLTNMQMVVAENLSYGISLHLRLKGFKFKYLNIEFNKSTITDELKYQQAQEYKIKNNQNLYKDGIIGQDKYADNMGYKKPDQPEPRLPLEQRSGASAPESDAKKKRNDQKDASDRKQRDKAKPQGSKEVPTKVRP